MGKRLEELYGKKLGTISEKKQNNQIGNTKDISMAFE